jgi:hypothetical protein
MVAVVLATGHSAMEEMTGGGAFAVVVNVRFADAPVTPLPLVDNTS